MSRTIAIHNESSGTLDSISGMPHHRRKRQQQHQYDSQSVPVDVGDATEDDTLHSDQYVYRLHFSIVDKNRSWMRGIKRSITWVFGLANLAALREGKVGRECRGEEHTVQIVRKQTSGKIRIFWNGFEISHFFRQRCFRVDNSGSSSASCSPSIEFSWKTRSGECLRIVGSVDDDLSEESINFDLLVDDVSFTKLPTVRQLGRKTEKAIDQRSPSNDLDSSSIATSDPDADHSSEAEQEFRLSMVGFNSMATLVDEENNDELHSDLYSRSLASLRKQIIRCLPQVEEMISRGIINAFYVEPQSCGDMTDVAECQESTHNLEANHIYDARCWVRLNVNFAPREDIDDLVQQYLQRCIDSVFVSIREEELNADDAARIVLNVAAVLGFEFSTDIAQDTILLEEIPIGSTIEGIHSILSQFGEIDQVSISSKSSTFGFCRYVVAESASRAMSCFHRNISPLNGMKLSLLCSLPSVSSLLNVSIDETDHELEANEIETSRSIPISIMTHSPTSNQYHNYSSPTTVMHDILHHHHNSNNNNFYYNYDVNRCDTVHPQVHYNNNNKASFCSTSATAAACY